MLLIYRHGEESEISFLLEGRETIVDLVRKDNRIYAFISSEGRRDYADFFQVCEQDETGEWEIIYKNDFRDLKPWKLVLGDIDGDGEDEIITAVRKMTPFDRQEKNRLFIFRYSEGILMKQWTGSQIGGIWRDFIVGDIVPTEGEEIVLIESRADGKERLCLYYWFDFGFQFMAESDYFDKITRIWVTPDNDLSVEYRAEKQKEKKRFEIRNNQLIPKED